MGSDFERSDMVKYTIYNVFSITHNNLKASWIECNSGCFLNQNPAKVQLMHLPFSFLTPLCSDGSIKSWFCWNHFILCFLVQCFELVWLYSSIGVEKIAQLFRKEFPFKACRNLLFNLERNLQNRVVCMSCKYCLVFWPRIAWYITQPNMILCLSLSPFFCDMNSDELRISSLPLSFAHPSLSSFSIDFHNYNK